MVVRIGRLIEERDQRAAIARIEAIFFAAASVRSFADAAARSAFRERWLGRYLDHWPQLALVAAAPDGDIAGYLVGCLESPAGHPLFADIGYFAAFAEPCARYPAHLHINLDSRYRGQGTGTALIEAFCRMAVEAGSPGVHIVTGRTARNVGFYRRNGFAVVAGTTWGGNEVVLMGRELGRARPTGGVQTGGVQREP